MVSAADDAGAAAAAAAAADGVARGGRAGSGRSGGGADDAGDEVHHLVLGGRVAQGVGEVLLHQRAGELGQQLQVGRVATGRRRDQEGQVGRAVLGAEVTRRVQPGEGQRGHLDVRGAAVRDGDASGQARRRGRLPRQRVVGQARRVVAATGGGDDLGERPDHGGLVVPQVVVEPHERAVDQGSGHGGHLSSLGAAVAASAGGAADADGAAAAAVDAGAGRVSSGTGWTSTRSGRTWWGAGIVVPGSEAAALP